MRTNLICKQGETFDETFTWRNPDGSLVNLTGWSGSMFVAADYATSPVLKTSGGTPNITLTLGGAAGTVRVVIAAADTAALTAPLTYVYNLKLTSPTAAKTRFIEGEFNTTPEVREV